MAITPVVDDAIRTGDDWTVPVRFWLDAARTLPRDVSAWTWVLPDFRETGHKSVITTGTLDLTAAAAGLVVMQLAYTVTETFLERFRSLTTDLQSVTPNRHTWVEIVCAVDPDYSRP